MKRNDYKYVYNTLPKFRDFPFEKQTWFIKNENVAREVTKDICELVIPALQSGKLVFCTYYDTKNKVLSYFIKVVTTSSTASSLIFTELSFPGQVSANNTPAIVTCVVF